jgi:hypothetical protein
MALLALPSRLFQLQVATDLSDSTLLSSNTVPRGPIFAGRVQGRRVAAAVWWNNSYSFYSNAVLPGMGMGKSATMLKGDDCVELLWMDGQKGWLYSGSALL